MINKHNFLKSLSRFFAETFDNEKLKDGWPGRLKKYLKKEDV
jgi:hypothetical protein